MLLPVFSCTGAAATKPSTIDSTALVSLVALDEPGDTIIHEVQNLSLSPDGQEVLLVDESTGRGSIFSRSGRLIRSYYFSASMSDSIVAINPHFFDHLVLMRGDHIRDSIGRAMPLLLQRKNLPNALENGIFLNDTEVLLAGHVLAFARAREDPSFSMPTNIAKFTTLVIANTRDGKYRIIPTEHQRVNEYQIYQECNGLTCSRDRSVVYLDEEYWLGFKKNLYDSMWAVASFASSGKKLVDLALLPPECHNSVIDYGNMRPHLCLDSSDHPHAAFNTLPRIYDLANRTSFELKNLPFNNDTFFRAGKTVFMRHQKSVNMDSIGALIRVWMLNISVSKRNTIIAVTSNKIQWYPWKYIFVIQEYSLDGDLLKQMELPYNLSIGMPLYATYDPQNDQVLVTVQSPDGWKLATYRWGN